MVSFNAASSRLPTYASTRSRTSSHTAYAPPPDRRSPPLQHPAASAPACAPASDHRHWRSAPNDCALNPMSSRSRRRIAPRRQLLCARPHRVKQAIVVVEQCAQNVELIHPQSSSSRYPPNLQPRITADNQRSAVLAQRHLVRNACTFAVLAEIHVALPVSTSQAITLWRKVHIDRPRSRWHRASTSDTARMPRPRSATNSIFSALQVQPIQPRRCRIAPGKMSACQYSSAPATAGPPSSSVHVPRALRGELIGISIQRNCALRQPRQHRQTGKSMRPINTPRASESIPGKFIVLDRADCVRLHLQRKFVVRQ